MVPSESLADALSVTVAGAVKVAPFAGAVSVAVGGWLAGASTRMLTVADDVLAPPLSTATAFSEYVPAGTAAHVTQYGADVTDPSDVDPAKKSTLETVSSVSLAAAVTTMSLPAVKIDPSAGDVIAACGG